METSQEVNLLMDTVRRFVETEMFPYEEEIDRLGHVPEEIGRTIEAKSLPDMHFNIITRFIKNDSSIVAFRGTALELTDFSV